jgi:hypothetical protein
MWTGRAIIGKNQCSENMVVLTSHRNIQSTPITTL